MRLLAVIAVVGLLSAVASASLFSWVDTNRPPISLSEALTHGDKLLGDKRDKYYCINAHIYGNKEGDGKGGAWNLLYGAKDGSRMHVGVNMQGVASMRVWNGPVDWKANKGRRSDISEVESRLVAVLKSEKLAPDNVDREDKSFTVFRSTRDFAVHSKNEDGSYSDDTVTVVGPTLDGIWIHAYVVESQPPEAPYRWEGPYWNLSEQNYLLANGNGFLVVEMRYGHKFPRGVTQQLNQVFGERVP